MTSRKPRGYTAPKVVLDKKYSMITYLATLVIAVILRTVQLNGNMDFASGKYINGGFSNNLPLIAILIGMGVTIAVLIFGESRDKAIKSCILINPMRLKADRLKKKMSPACAGGMIIMAVLFLFEMGQNIIIVTTKNADLSTEDNPVPIFEGISGTQWLLYGFMIVLIITFISTAVNIFQGEGISRGNCFFLLFVPIWELIKIFDLIKTYQVIGPYSEKCYMLLTDMLVGIFFLYVVRFFCGYEKKHTRLMLCISGYLASILAAVSTIPRFIMFFSIDYSKRDGMLSPNIYDMGFIFCTVAIVAVFWSTYVYRVMPKLNITGKRRWSGITLETSNKDIMKDINED